MTKKVAILQSNYIPWKGYFDIINMVDLFVFYDDLQYTKQDWRNRNKIKSPQGPVWISIPCGSDIKRLICDVKPLEHRWQQQHWDKMVKYYNQAPYFKKYSEFFEDFYLNHTWENLSELNQYLIKKISKELLDISTTFDDSRGYNLSNSKAERLIELLKKTEATNYLSGPAAKNYLNESHLEPLGIELEWMDYSNYPVYDQLYAPFEHGVSIVDLLFNVGPDFKKYMLSY